MRQIVFQIEWIKIYRTYRRRANLAIIFETMTKFVYLFETMIVLYFFKNIKNYFFKFSGKIWNLMAISYTKRRRLALLSLAYIRCKRRRREMMGNVNAKGNLKDDPFLQKGN